MKTPPGYLAFQIFALEVFRKDPELFKSSMMMASTHLEAMKKEAGSKAIAEQEQAIDVIYSLTSLLEMFDKEDVADLPDIELLDGRTQLQSN